MIPFFILSQIQHIYSQSISKTPNFSSGAEIIAPTPDFIRPEDYPQDLIDWYEQNMDTRSYVVIDAETNRVIAQKAGNTPYPVASMSKLLSTYLIYEAIENDQISLDTEITISSEIEDAFTSNPNLSNVGLLVDEVYTVEELLHGILIQSGNDATSAVLWEIYGSEQDATKAMNDKLAEWHITSAKMYTVSGAPNAEIPKSLWYPGSSEADQNIMSAADMALVGQYLVEDYPEVLDITSKMSYTLGEGTDYAVTIGNSNLLLPETGSEFARPGVDGLKSGFTDGAGRCFITHSTDENGREIYAVVMGIFDEYTNSFWETEILLDGLQEYPNMYQNEDLPTNLRQAPEEENVDESNEDKSTESQTEVESMPNRRNNPLTNFMRDITQFLR